VTGETHTAPFRVVVGSSGSSTLAVSVTVGFARCPLGTASAVTTAPSAVPSNVVKFGAC
jgi:hypothetical protein